MPANESPDSNGISIELKSIGIRKSNNSVPKTPIILKIQKIKIIPNSKVAGRFTPVIDSCHRGRKFEMISLTIMNFKNINIHIKTFQALSRKLGRIYKLCYIG